MMKNVTKTRVHEQDAVNVRVDLNTLEAQIDAIRTNNGFVSIRGYKSESGRVANILVQPLGPNGYERLVKESLEQVKSGNVTKPDNVDQDVWEKAIESQLTSWEKTLAGGHGRKNNFEKKEDKKEFYQHVDNGNTMYIKNIRIIRKNVITEGEYKKVNSRPLTIAKKLLVKQTPVNKYQGCFKLDTGKFDSIHIQGEVLLSE
jgi:hypothetical protein